MRAVFEENLTRLSRRDPALAEVLSRSPSSSRAALVKRGAAPASLVIDGIRVTSGYAPETAAARSVDPLLESEPDLLVAFGFAMGEEVAYFRRKRSAPVIIYEPCLDALRVVLANHRYAWIDAEDVEIVHDTDALAIAFRRRYTTGFRVAMWVPPPMKRLAPRALNDALQVLARTRQSADIADRTRALRSRTFAEQSVGNLRALLDTPNLSALFGRYAGVPAVVAAAGPSLDRQLEGLRRERERFFLIAIGQSLPALRRAGIRPDFTHVVESQDVSHQLSDGAGSDDVDLVLIPSAHGALFRAPVASRFVAYPAPNALARWVMDAYGEDQWVYGGASVAQSAVQIAAALGADPILLVGQDLAFTGGRVYATDSAYRMVSFRETSDQSFVYTGEDHKAALLGQAIAGNESRETRTVWVEGWDGAPVPTSPQYAAFIDHYAEIAERLKRAGSRLVNCTEGGARIPGLDHGVFEEVLSELPGVTIDRQAFRRECARSAPRDPELLRPRVSAAGRSLERLERVLRAAEDRFREMRRDLVASASPERQLAALQRLARSERALLRAIAALPWLDTIGQDILQRNRVAQRRAAELNPVERAQSDARGLLESTREIVGHGRALLAQIERELER